MRIFPIVQNYGTAVQYKNNRVVQNKQIPFASGGSYNMGAITEHRLKELKTVIDTEIRPNYENNRDLYIRLAKIGYDSQEKLKRINYYETKLMHTKLSAPDNPEFKKVQELLKPYETYQNNIKEFERTEEFVKTRPIYKTDEILNAIEKSRPKIYRDREEFEKLTPLYERFSKEKIKLDNDLEKIISKNNPEFFAKIQKLNDENKEAVLLFMISDFQESADIIKEYEDIVKAGRDKKNSPLVIYERTEKLAHIIDNLLYDRDKKERINNEIKDYIENHKNYEKENLSAEEIEKEYKNLIKQAQTAISRSGKTLENKLPEYQTQISPRISDRAIKAQARAIKHINNLIQQEKEKMYNLPQE